MKPLWTTPLSSCVKKNMTWPSLLFRLDGKAQAIQHRMVRAILHHHIREGDIPWEQLKQTANGV